MKPLSSLSIFFPSLNDAKSLPQLIQKADIVAKKLTQTYEIIVINDGSTDETPKVLKQLQKHFLRLRVVTHQTNRGYGAALISGFTTAKYTWVFYTDGDGQYDPTELTQLAKHVDPTIDVVNGYKKNRADSFVRKIIGTCYNWFVHRTNTLPIRDIDCDFRLIRRSKLSSITLTSQTGTICVELITKLHAQGARFAEVPVSHYKRRFGHSEFFRLPHLVTTFRSLMRRGF